MRAGLSFAALIAFGTAAFADGGPVIVIPSRPGVPIVINGQDVSYAVLEGDWGLASRIHVQPTVYGGGWNGPYKPPVGHYYPHTGHMPGIGRLEIETPSHQLPQAESFYRGWGIESQPTAPTSSPPVNMPVVVAPNIGPDDHDSHHHYPGHH